MYTPYSFVLEDNSFKMQNMYNSNSSHVLVLIWLRFVLLSRVLQRFYPVLVLFEIKLFLIITNKHVPAENKTSALNQSRCFSVNS